MISTTTAREGPTRSVDTALVSTLSAGWPDRCSKIMLHLHFYHLGRMYLLWQPGYNCICARGYTNGDNSPACVDVDECNDPSHPYPCSSNPRADCVNFDGGFHCGQCPAGSLVRRCVILHAHVGFLLSVFKVTRETVATAVTSTSAPSTMAAARSRLESRAPTPSARARADPVRSVQLLPTALRVTES